MACINQQIVLKSISTRQKHAQFPNFDWDFIFPRLPPKVIPGEEQEREVTWGLEESWKKSGVPPSLPHSHPFIYASPQWKKKAESISQIVLDIETHAQEDMVTGYSFGLCIFSYHPLFRNLITL